MSLETSGSSSTRTMDGTMVPASLVLVGTAWDALGKVRLDEGPGISTLNID